MPDRDRSRFRRYSFHRYSGGDPLAAPVDISEALERIGESVMAGGSPERALREYLRRGGRDRTGLDDLAARIAQRRRELRQRGQLDGTLREVKELLDRAVLAERKQLARDVDLDDLDRSFSEMRLDSLPPSTPAAVSELSDYQWRSSDAKADYDRIRDLLGRELLDQRFAGMKQALEGVDDDDRAAVSKMLGDLNELLAKHRAGTDTAEDFERFMAEHGRFFPENPTNVDELADALAKRSAAAQRMLNSMTPAQREELMQLSAQAFGSPELAQQLAELDGNLHALRPGEDWSGSTQMDGEGSMGLGEATGVMQDLADLDQLADQLAQAHAGARLDDIDLDALGRQLGPAAVVDARALRALEKELRESGALRRDSSGQLRLTPQAMRRLGASLLRDIASRLAERAGQRDTSAAGAAGELSGATRPWAFGDTEPWDIPRTILNGVLRRSGAAPGGAGGRAIEMDDIEVSETEARTRAGVVLLVDTSFSMEMAGRWVPMKRTALALHTLIRSRFRDDALELIAFSRWARAVDIEEITALDARWDKGTNLHHALLLANRWFRRHPDAQPVLLIVTDGEPTAHLEGDGEVFFDYPPQRETILRTVKELDNSGRLGAQITFFRLGDDPGLARFIDAMARRVDGRVVAPEDDDLGAAVIGSYLGSRGGRPGDGDASDLFPQRSRGWW